LVPEPEQDISEDQVNVAEDVTEAPNQSSEVVDTPDPRIYTYASNKLIDHKFYRSLTTKLTSNAK
jgi:hypothetical protein